MKDCHLDVNALLLFVILSGSLVGQAIYASDNSAAVLKKAQENLAMNENKSSQQVSSENAQKNNSAQSVMQAVEVTSYSSYIDMADYFHVVGEIQNGSPSVITSVKVIGTFYDKNHKVVGTTYTFTDPPDLAPGEKAPFDLILSSASVQMRQITNYEFVIGSIIK